MTAEPLPDLLHSLGYHMGAKNRAQATVDQYSRALSRFYHWLAERGEPDLAAVRQGDIEEYLDALRQAGLAPGTVRYQYAGLQGAFKWHSRREGYPSPMLQMEKPKVPESHKDVVPLDEQRRIMLSLDRQKRYRDAAIVSLLLENGMRVSELCGLDVADLRWKTDEVVIRDTKNDEVRVVPFLPATGERLDLWQRKRTDKGSPWLFSGQRGQRITRSGVLQMVKRTFDGLGWPNIGPHDLRHTFATTYLDANPHGAEDLKAVGGWKSDTMVQMYAKKGRARRSALSFRQNSPLG
jgi:integrase/recombinase XerC